jgi:hypothetical protein
MKFTKLIVLLFVSLETATAFSQTSQQKKLLPMLAPTTPEAAALGRYGSYEVNLFTGIPDISIPIYEVKVGELSIPISISYHASGIKIAETASRVGLGWSLTAGGTITRKIQGRPDEKPQCYFDATNTSSFRVRDVAQINGALAADLTYLANVDTKIYDGEPDIFSYSFPGHNGRFLFNQKDNFKAFLIPYSPIAVTKTYINSENVYFSFLDEGGRKYSFNTFEGTSTSSAVGLNANTASSWLLSQILSANVQDTISLKYSPISVSDQYENEYFIINDNVTGDGAYYNNDFGTFSGEIVNTSTMSQRLDTIIFNGGKVVFEEAPESRADFNGLFYLQKRLKYIKVYAQDPVTKTYSLNKVVQFFHSYFQSGTDNNTKRLRLDSLQILSSLSVPVQTYKFGYNNAIALPAKLSKQKDFWGYYNAKNSYIPNTITPTSIPRIKHTYVQPPGAPYDVWIGGTSLNARDPDPAYMQAAILQQIDFPTGGFTQFAYETNQYLDDNNNPAYAGGLRIKTIKSFAASNATPLLKTYKYGLNESGFGRANFFLEQSFFANHQNCRWVDLGVNGANMCHEQATKTMHTYFANPSNDIEGSDGSPVVYTYVTEYDGDFSLEGELYKNNGKTIYQFTDKADAKNSLIGYGKIAFDSYQFVRGLLTNKQVYRNNSLGTYSKLSEQQKKYQFFPFQWSTGGIGIVVKKLQIDQGNAGTMNDIGTSYANSCGMYTDAYNYMFNNYNIVSGDNKLTEETNIVYDQNDELQFVKTTVTYTYDDLTHLNISQTQTTNSKEELLKTVYTYPYNNTAFPYTAMDAAHIWDKRLSETQINGTTQISKQVTNYNSFGTPYPKYLPANIQIQLKANTIESRANFNTYDTRGNILEMQKAGDVKQSYLWDYNNLHPVAEVTGASQNEIAYTSFEADGNGGWSGITAIAFSVNGSITGERAYTQNNFSLSKSGLNAGGTYIVSYWSKNGSYSVNGATINSIRTTNGWSYFQHTVVNPAGGVITVTGSGTIDELRLYPLNSFMKTYTYEPLTGLSSQCDVNNRIVYYLYDDAGRLLLIKDDAGYILKKNCYNYNGQSGNCTIYGNALQNANYTRNNCTAGYNGSQVAYNVAANTYYASTQANANTLAQNEIAANGQSYANSAGTCTAPPITITGSNSKSISYTVKFTKSSNTTVWYSFSLPAGASNSTLGQIPPDTYNVQFQPGGNPPSANFSIGSFVITNVTGASFNNISLSTNTLARVY